MYADSSNETSIEEPIQRGFKTDQLDVHCRYSTILLGGSGNTPTTQQIPRITRKRDR
jgi:hypothetical protein